MEKIKKKSIDWEETGKNLQRLRERNFELTRYACFICHYDEADCDGECETCSFEKDLDRRITREELAKVFEVTDAVINNWETGRTAIPLEELYMYCEIIGKPFEEILVFKKE